MASVDVARVEDLIAERIDCRYARDFEGADAIRAELKQSHGVIVNDRERLWFVDNGRSRTPDLSAHANGHDYTFVHSEGVEVEPDEALLSNIHELLAKRLQAKFDRKFDEADACKAKLEGLGVRIFDKNREWSYKPLLRPTTGLGHD